MKLLSTAFLLFSSIASACPDCSPNHPSNVNNANADAYNTSNITNSANMINPVSLMAPQIPIPQSAIGKDIISCADDFVATTVGVSGAKLKGANKNIFGNGTVGAGLSVSYVGVLGNNACEEAQEAQKEIIVTETAISKHVGCLRLINTYKESGVANPTQLILRTRELSMCHEIALELQINPNNFKQFDAKKNYGQYEPVKVQDQPIQNNIVINTTEKTVKVEKSNDDMKGPARIFVGRDVDCNETMIAALNNYTWAKGVSIVEVKDKNYDKNKVKRIYVTGFKTLKDAKRYAWSFYYDTKMPIVQSELI